MKDGKKKRPKGNRKNPEIVQKIRNRANKIMDIPDKNKKKLKSIKPHDIMKHLHNSLIFVGERKRRILFGEFEEYLYFAIRGVSSLNEIVRYHGTSFAGLVGVIQQKRIVPSSWGMLGPGVYVGHWEKARNFGEVILEVKCNMGKITQDPSDWKADTVAALRGSNRFSVRPLINDEWCIRNSKNVDILGVYIKKSVLEVNNV